MSSDTAVYDDALMNEWFRIPDNYPFDIEVVEQQYGDLGYSQEDSSTILWEAGTHLDSKLYIDSVVDITETLPLPDDNFNFQHEDNSQLANQPNLSVPWLDNAIDAVDSTLHEGPLQFDGGMNDYNQTQFMENSDFFRNSELPSGFEWMMQMDTDLNASFPGPLARFTELPDDYPSNSDQAYSNASGVVQTNGNITVHYNPLHGTFRRSEDIQLVAIPKKR